MTEQRAKEMLQQIAYDGEYPMGSTDAFNMAIKALEEIEQYRALGTVEELRVARDKQVAKKPIQTEQNKIGYYSCQSCKQKIGTTIMTYQSKHCPYCGQKLDWEEV